MSAGDAQYLFLPYLRRGLAAAIRQDATGSRATLDVQLQVGNREQGEWPTKRIALYGPGDILGFDARIVVRTEPRPNIGDFEPNYFPFIEFAEPDFPWRFTAAGNPSDDAPSLKPWIALIVLRTEEVEEPDVAINPTKVDEDGRDPDAQVPRIMVSTRSLPDLADAGRWAHVQITGHENEFANAASEQLSKILENEPERVVSRLLCARRLRPGVKYTAYVVPTFKLGKDAANPSSETVGVSALEPAWSHSNNDDVTLPYYYKWEFRTGRRGDFEHLVRRFEPRPLSGLGSREVGCQYPGYKLTAPAAALGFESALKSIDMQYIVWGEDSQESLADVATFRTGLSNLLNLGDDDPTPKVVPPLYGRWHKAQSQVDSESIGWFDELNLDPRHRWAAGLGAEVVRKQQEQLMASAWDQLGDIEAVNEILRRAQFAREVATKAEARLDQLPSWDYLRATAPLLGLVEIERAGEVSVKKTTVEQRIHDSPIRKAPLDPALRRLGRKRGSLRKHQRPRSHKFRDDLESRDVLDRLNQRDRPGGIRVVSKSVPARGVPTLRRIAGDIVGETQLKITSEPPQEKSVGKFRYVLTYKNAEGGKIEIEKPKWLERSGDKDGQLTLMVEEGRLPAPPIAKGALMSKIESYHVTIRVKDQIQSFDLNVWAKKNSSTQAIASGAPPSPLVYIAAVNVSTKIAEFCGDEWATNLKTRLSEVGELDATAGAVVAALDGWLKPAKPAPPEPSPIEDKDLKELLDKIKADLRPAKTVAEHASSRFQRSGPAASEAAALNHIIANPEFPQPMWGALEELSQEYLLAGIEKVPQNTIALMETNRRFVEAFLCGLNHEFSRELLWREYPTDQRGTYFRQFWDKRGYPAQDEVIKDILPIIQWGESLGNNAPKSSKKVGYDDSLVLLLRGDLFNKYPNTILYLAKPAASGGGVNDSFTERRDPIFTVTARPDIACIGFDMSAESVIDEGWYLVLEERVSEARFGLDEATGSSSGITPSDLSWDDFSENEEEYPVDKYLDARVPCMEGAAAVASITMQDPVRVIISAKQMIPPVAHVSGQIVTEEGQAISGAAVSVGEKNAQTDQEGRFSLDRLTLGKQMFTVRHPDYRQHDEEVDLGGKPIDLPREMIPLPGMISGNVTDHFGNGLGGVRVFYTTGKETVSDEPKGDFEFTDVAVGGYTVTAEHDGFKPESKPVSVESRATAVISFSLTPNTGTISVRVTDHQGKILRGARVAAGGKESRNGDSEGVYELTEVPAGHHKISIELAGFETQWQPVTVEGGKLTSAPPFSLIPTTGTISGKVRGRGNELLPGVTISVGDRNITTKTGEFVFENVPEGDDLTLTLSHPSYVARSLPMELNSGEKKVIDETLSLLPGIVEGTVRKVAISNGRRVTSLLDGAKVELGNRSEWTKNGHYRFDNVRAGSHQVSVSYPGCSAQPQTVEVQGAGRKEWPVDLTLFCLSLDPRNPRLWR